jgi:hypothetical protein
MHEQSIEIINRKNRWINMQLELKKQLVDEECTFEPIIICSQKSKERKTLWDSDFAQTQNTVESKSKITNESVYVRNSEWLEKANKSKFYGLRCVEARAVA